MMLSSAECPRANHASTTQQRDALSHRTCAITHGRSGKVAIPRPASPPAVPPVNLGKHRIPGRLGKGGPDTQVDDQEAGRLDHDKVILARWEPRGLVRVPQPG